MYKSPTKQNLPNQHKSPQRLTSPTLRSFKQKYQTQYLNRNVQNTEKIDKDSCIKSPEEDKNIKKLKKCMENSNKQVCMQSRDEKMEEKMQKNKQLRSKIKNNLSPNSRRQCQKIHQDKKAKQLEMQRIKGVKKDIRQSSRKQQHKINSYNCIQKQDSLRTEKQKLYQIQSNKCIMLDQRQIGEKQMQLSNDNYSTINNPNASSLQLQMLVQKNNNLHSNDNQQNLLNQLQQVCYQNYVIKSLPNIQTNLLPLNEQYNKNKDNIIICFTSEFEKLKNFINGYIDKYQCQLHKKNQFKDTPTNRKVDLICLNCNLLLCDYCVLFGNGQNTIQGQKHHHQLHKMHKLIKFQEFMSNFKSFLQKYQEIKMDLSRINQEYSKKFVPSALQSKDRQQHEQMYNNMLTEDVELLSGLNCPNLVEQILDKCQQQDIQKFIQIQQKRKIKQIHSKIGSFIKKILEVKYETYKIIHKQYKNIKQNINNKILSNKALFTQFYDSLQTMLYYVTFCLWKVGQITRIDPNQLQQNQHKQKIEQILKILSRKTPTNKTINQIVQIVEKQMLKYKKQNRISKQFIENKFYVEQVIKISYNTYMQENADSFITICPNINIKIPTARIQANKKDSLHFKTPNKKQYLNAYNFKSNDCNFKNMQKSDDNFWIQQEQKQNQFLMDFYEHNTLNKVKSDHNLFKSLDLFGEEKQKERQKYKSGKKQSEKKQEKVKCNIEKEKNVQIWDESVLSLSIMSKQNQNTNNIKSRDINTKLQMSGQKYKYIIQKQKQKQKQEHKQMRIRNIIDQFCQQFNKNQNQGTTRRCNKQLDLSNLQLDNTQLLQIFSHIHTKLYQLSSSRSLTLSKSQIVGNKSQFSPNSGTNFGKFKLSFVKLSDNKITSQGFISIASYLTSASNLNMSYNLLDIDVLDYIIKNKDKFAPLRILNLKGNFKNLGQRNINKQAYLEKKIKEKVGVLGKMGILINL